MKRIATAILSIGCWTGAWSQPGTIPHPRVIVIGIDGLGADGLARAKAPHLHALLARAAWTLEARGVMPTLSSPNWASMITGAGTEQHGITSNGYLRNMMEFQPVVRDASGMFPTIFEVLRTERPESSIAIFHDWPGFADLVEKNAPDVLKHERGAARTTNAAVTYWTANHPDLMFVHLDDVDHAGHEYGWGSAEYDHAMTEADGYAGAILDMVEGDLLAGSTYVLVSSDHGGKGRGHGKNSLAEIQIPWILAGPDVIPGRITAPVYTFDTAATVAWLLGIQLSEYAIGRPVAAAFRQPASITRGVTVDPAGRECTPERITGPTGPAAGVAAQPLAHGVLRNREERP